MKKDRRDWKSLLRPKILPANRFGGVYETKTRDRDNAIEAYRRIIREKPGTGDALEANRRIEYLLQAAPKSR
ncbi:MAG: hypothetical protein NTZ78_03945 [Candidatus Aureabacteria bacterium]|nr:hypothetical protein [Candidatus Auribacterota bacterium]